MSGGVGIRLPWSVREAVGLYPAPHGLVLVRLCAAEEHGGAWMVTESRTSEEPCPASSDAEAFASFVHAQLIRAGWEKIPLALALPLAEVDTEERELPVLLEGAELHAALLWALRAEEDDTGGKQRGDVRLCAVPMSNTTPHRYWMARMDASRIEKYFSVFTAAGLPLRRLTVFPPVTTPLEKEIEEAREPRMPWESAEDDALVPAVYAGLLVRKGMPVNLYWTTERSAVGSVCPHAAAIIAVIATGLFLANVTADIAACMAERQARDHAVEELALRSSERARMKTFYALRANVAQHEQLLSAFTAESLPVRALLIHLGSMTVDGVRLTCVRAEEHAVRIEGEAVHYAALAALMGAMEEDPFFSADIALEHAGPGEQAEDMIERIHFILSSSW